MSTTTEITQGLANAIVDIVFVHGLHGKEEPWKSERGVSWPDTLLSTKVPNARILSFNYPAKISTFFDKEGLANPSLVSDELIRGVMGHRKSADSKNRPIIFIAHCLGGVVLENALVRVSKHPKNKALIPCIRGILLLGSPHFKNGLLTSVQNYYKYALSLGEDLEDSVPKDIPNPNHLISITRAFADLATKDEAKFDIEGFIASKDNVVDEVLAQWSEDSQPQFLGCTQLGLSQYEDENDSGFEVVLETISEWLKIDQGPKEQKGSGTMNNSTITGSHNSGIQLGQNTSPISGFTFNTTHKA